MKNFRHCTLIGLLMAGPATFSRAELSEEQMVSASKWIGAATSVVSLAFFIRVSAQKLALKPGCPVNLVPACCSVQYNSNGTQIPIDCRLGTNPFDQCSAPFPVLECINAVQGRFEEASMRPDAIDAQLSTILPASNTLGSATSAFATLSTLVNIFMLNAIDTSILAAHGPALTATEPAAHENP